MWERAAGASKTRYLNNHDVQTNSSNSEKQLSHSVTNKQAYDGHTVHNTGYNSCKVKPHGSSGR